MEIEKCRNTYAPSLKNLIPRSIDKNAALLSAATVLHKIALCTI